MTDTIYINDLSLYCTIGVTELERSEKQPVIINISLSVDLQKPSQTDNIFDTLDYKKIYRQVVKLVEKSRFDLIEALAQAIASLCLKHSQVQQVKIHITKPKALKLAKSAAVEIIRSEK
jgi:FolB domain-containing protein